MTTEQTGGGNGAAPNGGSGQQDQPRIVPTAPGWWWATVGRAAVAETVLVLPSMRVMVTGWTGDTPVESRGFAWLAPIPGPEVCAALARYAESVEMADSKPRGMSSTEIMSCFAASDALDAAIRAERDAERDGGA